MASRIIRFIGDLHGRYRPYRRIITDAPPSIAIGDVGVGFIRYGGAMHGSFHHNPPHQKMVKYNARFIRGNHDNPDVCKKHSQYIPDGTIEGNMMFLGGSISIDREYRIPFYSWWPGEELSQQELYTMIDIYQVAKPEIMVTHDCPIIAARYLCAHAGRTYFGDGCRTREALQQMFEFHQPKIHVFGHWHYSYDAVIDGCRFICLNELEWIDLDTEALRVVGNGQG